MPQYVHHIGWSFISPTWTLLQMPLVFKEGHIATLDDLLGLQANQPICLGALTIAKENALDALCIKLGSPLIGHLGISNTTKHAHVRNARPLTTPCLFGRHTLDSPSGAPVASIHRITHRLGPKLKPEALGMHH